MAQLTEIQNIEIVKKILSNISEEPITFDDNDIYTNFIKICQELLRTSSLTEEERINRNMKKEKINEEDIRIKEITEYVPKELHKYAKKLIKLYPGITSNPYELPRSILTDYNKKATNESYNRYLDQEYIGMSEADYNLLKNSKFYISELLKKINPSFVKYVDAFFDNNLHKRSLFSLFDDTLSSVIHMTAEDIVIFNNYLTNELLKKINPIFEKYSQKFINQHIPIYELFVSNEYNINNNFLISTEIGMSKEDIVTYNKFILHIKEIDDILPENLKKYTLAFIMDNKFNNTIFIISHARLKEFYGMTDIEIKQMSDLRKVNSTSSDNNLSAII